jgi:hypothetical protein
MAQVLPSELNGSDARQHTDSGRSIGRMHTDAWRHNAAQTHSFLDPEDHVVPGAACIVAQIVVQTYFGDLTSLPQGNSFIGPINASPALGGFAFVGETNLH